MKRSAQIGLVVMAAAGIGATSYAVMPREDCGRPEPGFDQSDACRSSRGGSGGSGHGGSGYGSSSSSSSSSRSSSGQTGSSSGASPASFVGSTEHGGFGSFARSIGAHFSGG